MSICNIGLEAKLKRTSVTISVCASEPFIRLANALIWLSLAAIVEPDLRRTKKGMWTRGRRLYLRVHLAVLILQCLLKETDRGIEERIRQSPVFQIFCGRGIIPRWKCPDHTKIEEFRNRLLPETHQRLGVAVIKIAQSVGFADPSWMDVDSTVQEANMAYPADSTIMKKLAEKCHKVLSYLRKKKKAYLPKIGIQIEDIRRKAQSYFFLAKNASMELRRKIFKEFHQLVKKELRPVINFFESMNSRQLKALPWNIRRAVEQARGKGWRYLLDVGHFVRTHGIKAGKILSFHTEKVACIKKGKAGKDKEFGRVFQLGRIGGNFLIAFACTSVRMNDKQELIPAIEEHRKIFGADVLKSVGTDKGYYSAANVRKTEGLSINADGLQRPANIKSGPTTEIAIPLRDRRAGIEPLIGHAKTFGLGKSRMKSDDASLASGYRSVMGFNLHQLTRHMTGKVKTG